MRSSARLLSIVGTGQQREIRDGVGAVRKQGQWEVVSGVYRSGILFGRIGNGERGDTVAE